MKVLKLLYVLYKIRLLSPLGLYRLTAALFRNGTNLLMLLDFAERTYGEKVVLVDEKEKISYKELLSQSEQLSMALKKIHGLRPGQKVGFLCINHASLVKSIFAVARLGSDIYLLNTEMSKKQFNQLQDIHDFDLLIYDPELNTLIEQSSYDKDKVFSYHENLPAINNLLFTSEKLKLSRTSASKIVLLTGGTTGKSKEAVHQPSLFNYLNPSLALLSKLNLLKYKTAYIATPIYHGYGIAVFVLCIALGKKVVINNDFKAEKACDLIRKHHVEVVTVVPLMIHKMLNTNTEDLRSLACIASGGAELSPKLVNKVSRELGDVLYNLYGTSEAGLNVIATPDDLKYSPITIGKRISGGQLDVLDKNDNKLGIGMVGELCVKNSWSMRNSNWIRTGDLGYQDHQGYYFLCGRTDDLVVSAGENVYPIELEQILITHPQIEDVAVIGINDEEFGQRLQVFVHTVEGPNLSKDELFDWLRPRLARFQMPKEIVFVNNMPYTHLGKRDKKRLSDL
ncbi:AMP-binding protein [Virgibacillus sp. DJP39]|uniref:AMP-binding protein n=1 Tax=Virgibacillus sp. DJP39 TaxID=3409790 RepID=UPI003BB4EFFD